MHSAAVHEAQQLQRSQLQRRPLKPNGTCPEKDQRRRRGGRDVSQDSAVRTLEQRLFLAIHRRMETHTIGKEERRRRRESAVMATWSSLAQLHDVRQDGGSSSCRFRETCEAHGDVLPGGERFSRVACSRRRGESEHYDVVS